MKIEVVYKENSNIKLDDILKSIFEAHNQNNINNFFESLNIKEVDCIRKGDFTLC